MIFRFLFYVSGTDIHAPHGIPLDLLDRLLIIRTKPATQAEIHTILKIRAETEGIKIEDDALAKLADIGANASLRSVFSYSAQFLSFSTFLLLNLVDMLYIFFLQLNN